MSYGQNILHIFDFLLILIAYGKYYQFNNLCFDKTKMIYLTRTQVNEVLLSRRPHLSAVAGYPDQ